MFLNDLYWYWAETYRNLLDDKAKAWEYLVKCEAAIEDRSEWPSYWCILNQGEIARKAGNTKLAGERFRLAQSLGKHDGVFQAHMSRTRAAHPALFRVPSQRGCGCSLPARRGNPPGALALAAAVVLLAFRRSRWR